MISLSAVERAVQAELEQPELVLAAIALPDARKGEKIVLLVEGADGEAIQARLRRSSLPPLHRPARVYTVDKIPLLGSGKVDFAALRRLALEQEGESEA
jgi:acyl-[acyl-carrier-protein]-phospholipid O-acyltransferase/long-chain-fatty-acid--[acyl-carrier-protein] ligase